MTSPRLCRGRELFAVLRGCSHCGWAALFSLFGSSALASGVWSLNPPSTRQEIVMERHPRDLGERDPPHVHRALRPAARRAARPPLVTMAPPPPATRPPLPLPATTTTRSLSAAGVPARPRCARSVLRAWHACWPGLAPPAQTHHDGSGRQAPSALAPPEWTYGQRPACPAGRRATARPGPANSGPWTSCQTRRRATTRNGLPD